MKIVILDGYTENPGDLSWEGFEALGELTVYDRTPPEEVALRIGGAQAVLTNKAPITRETLEACPQLRYIGVLATGYNIVDIEAAHRHGVTVANVPTYGTAAVAQMALALLLEICHHAGHHSSQVFAGKWASCPDVSFWDFPLIELAGKTMGIVGFGRIGQATAKLAQAFGMRALATDSLPETQPSPYAQQVSLEQLLTESDVISLHCPLTPQTQGLIHAGTLAQMKDGVILLNTSRGQLINEADLVAALQSGKVYAAGLDVVSAEPILPDNPLLSAPNCIITPHIAWAPKESRARLMDVAVSNLQAYLAGKPENVV